MVPNPSSSQVREAIEEFQLYLSDILPPLVVAEAFKLLIQQPPSLMAGRIQDWTASQHRLDSKIALSDYIFHAVRKVFLIGEFRLVPREPFEPFLEELKGLLLAFCPEQQREKLRENLARLPESTRTLTTPVDELIRRNVADRFPAAPSGPALSAEQLRDLRRFSLLLERLGRQMSAEAESGPAEASGLLVSQALAAAARGSRSSRELEQHLEKLRELGMGLDTKDIFRTLGSSLPGWSPPAAAAERAAVDAMHRIVAQPEDPAEVARRFSQMVRAAVERFNEGDLAQAVTMLDLADRIAAEKRVDASTVEVAKLKGDEALDLERLRRYAEAQQNHPLLRRVLNFFTATSPKGLLAELLREMKRERRKLILQMLEVHGAPARREALERLKSAFGTGEGDDRWYFRRNLLYLLRRIPAARPDMASDEDVETAVRHAVLRFPAPLVKEAVANLGQLKHERSENTLIKLLEDLERMLMKPAGAAYDPREARLLIDRVIAGLARLGTTKARRAVVQHGLKKKAELGDTMARLSELTGQDLSGDTELVERLLAALKANSPRKLLGVVVHPNDRNAKHIIEALSTTPSPFVRKAFESLSGRFPNLEVGKSASAALASLESAARIPEAPYDTRSGEVELFGLPTLMKNLAESGLSGALTLKDSGGETMAEIVLRGGKMKSCEARRLTGEQAFYQLLERPAAGTFLFERKARDDRGDAGEPLQEVLPLCLEGMRRYDELQQASALVPDDIKLKPTKVRPEHHPEELDGMFVNGLWKLASGGATPLECEAALTADSYRIRRQLAYWVESGALSIED